MPNHKYLTSIDEELRILQDLPLEKRAEYIQNLADRREPYIQQLLDDLTIKFNEKYCINVTFIEEASAKLALAYFYLCYIYLKPSVNDNVNSFKMGSLMELLIVKEQIIIHPDPNEQRRANAIGGMSAAFSLIDSMVYHDKEDIFYVNTKNNLVDESMKEILKNHIIWLEMNGIQSSETQYDMPVFINGQFHELIYLMGRASYEIN